MGRPDYIFVNSEKPRDAAMRKTGTGFVVLSHHSLLLVCVCVCALLSHYQTNDSMIRVSN